MIGIPFSRGLPPRGAGEGEKGKMFFSSFILNLVFGGLEKNKLKNFSKNCLTNSKKNEMLILTLLQRVPR